MPEYTAVSPVTFNPSATWESALERACLMWGVQKDFWDIFGKHHIATPEVLANILRAMGVPSESRESLDAAIEERLWREWSVPVAPVLVESLSNGFVSLQLCPGATGTATFRWEDGSEDAVAVDTRNLLETGAAELRGQTFLRYQLPLPSHAPLGYHWLRFDGNGSTAECRLILCPDRAYQPAFLQSGGKGAGIAVSVYGLKSDRNWGCGDFTDLERFTTWAKDALKVSFIALNPLHSIPNRQPYNTSPYLPNCSFYRNGVYIDVAKLEEVQNSAWAQRILGSESFQARIAELRAAKYVEYEKVWSCKLKFLKLAFREFRRRGGATRAEFDRYVEAEGHLLHKFAVYQALDEVLHKRDRNLWIWPDWPAEYRDPNSGAVRQFEREYPRLIEFYKYIQWQIDRQLAAAQGHAKNLGLAVGLYHDLALATDRCGSDLWAHRPFYVDGCRVGSPPDDFSPNGQDWAFPPPNSVHHHETGYTLFIDSIRKNLAHAGALRIDHVMRFFRLFWIPDGNEANNGVYVRDFSDDLLRILALESVRNKVLVIGEDLGTVEPYIREALQKFGILSYRLLYFEKNSDGSFRKPLEYPRQALVSVSTHDLPTLAGFWTNRDIEARRQAGVLPDESSYQQQIRARAEDRQKMLDVMLQLGLLPSWFPRRASDVPDFNGELHNAAVGFLVTTPSELMVLNQEDLFKDTDQQNLPGTTEQYPNWRHKMRFALEELDVSAEARGCAQMFRSWIEKTGRANHTGN